MTAAREPVRTCVGCRTRDAKSTLVRIVSTSGGVTIDASGSAPGRGAYLHPGPACVRAAVRSGAIGRALNTGLGTDEQADGPTDGSVGELGRLRLEIERIGAV